MQKALIAVTVAVGLAALVGCTADSSDLPKLSIADAAVLHGKEAALMVDANGASTREKYGTIPGALLLTGYEYDVAEASRGEGQQPGLLLRQQHVFGRAEGRAQSRRGWVHRRARAARRHSGVDRSRERGRASCRRLTGDQNFATYLPTKTTS